MAIKTRTTIDGKVVKSQVTINWSTVTDQQKLELAERTIILKWQANYRNNKILPPEECTVLASDYTVGTRNTMTPEQAIALMSVEQLQKILEAKLSQ